MIISCPNCNKKFNLDENLIPEKGRLLQCSNCDHKWHYIIQKKVKKILEKDNQTKNIKKVTNISYKKNFQRSQLGELNNNNHKKFKNNIKNKNQNTESQNKKLSLGIILSNILIIFITFIALILVLDTFKNYISNYLPILIPLLDNLYLSVFDLIFFIKDLFN